MTSSGVVCSQEEILLERDFVGSDASDPYKFGSVRIRVNLANSSRFISFQELKDSICDLLGREAALVEENIPGPVFNEAILEPEPQNLRSS